jgi:Mitochondrial carrier protein
LSDYNKASWFQNFIASIAGASASLLVSAPLDVVKTRIQNRNFENPESGFRIVGSMIKNEGFTSFFKGLVPKVCFLPDNLKLPAKKFPAPDDRSQIGFLFLACTNPYPSL